MFEREWIYDGYVFRLHMGLSIECGNFVAERTQLKCSVYVVPFRFGKYIKGRMSVVPASIDLASLRRVFHAFHAR